MMEYKTLIAKHKKTIINNPDCDLNFRIQFLNDLMLIRANGDNDKIAISTFLNAAGTFKEIDFFKNLPEERILSIARKLFFYHNGKLNHMIPNVYFYRIYLYCLKYIPNFHTEILFNHLTGVIKLNKDYMSAIEDVLYKLEHDIKHYLPHINNQSALIKLMSNAELVVEIVKLRNNLQSILHLRNYELSKNLASLGNGMIVLSENAQSPNIITLDNIVIDILIADIKVEVDTFNLQRCFKILEVLNASENLLIKFARIIKLSNEVHSTVH